MPVEEVWGIGRQLTAFLNKSGIQTAWQLRNADDSWVKSHLTVVGLRTVWELRGISCLELEEISPAKKSIISSKSFGRSVMELAELNEALASYTARAAEKMRSQKSLATRLGVMIESKREGTSAYYDSRSLVLPQPTNYTPELVHYAKALLQKLFLPGIRYKKVGIALEGLVPEECYQADLFARPQPKQQALMRLLDRANGKLRFASEGVLQTWKMRQMQRSPRFTTRWNELLCIHI
jgi:DNA polymerase V